MQINAMQEIASIVVSWYFNTLFCSAIVAWAIYTFLKYKSEMLHIYSTMQSSLSKIREYPDRQEFLRKFNEFDEWMCNSDLLKNLWAEYKSTLIMPSISAENKIIRNTSESFCCFNEQSIASGTINFKHYSAFSNYLTGVGILGTFIGLVAGIYLASIGLASPDIDTMKTGLDNLLGGASLAFLTSICGVMTSITFSYNEKRIAHETTSIIEEWDKELNARIKLITPERLAIEQLDELKKQSELQEEFATKVAFNIAEALESAMQQRLVPGIASAVDKCLIDRLVPTLEKLVLEVEAMRLDRGDTNENILKNVVDQFSQTMSGAAGKEVAALSGTLSELHSNLVPLLKSMETANSSIVDNVLYISEGIKESYVKSDELFTESIKGTMEHVHTSFVNAGESFNATLQNELSPLVTDLKKSQVDMHDSVIRLTEKFEDAAIKSSESFAEGASKAIDQLRDGIADAGTALNGELKEAFGYTADRFDKAAHGLGQILLGMKDAGTSMGSVLVGAENVLKRFADSAASFASVSNQISALTKSLERAAQSIQGSGDAAQAGISLINETMITLKNTGDQIVNLQLLMKETLESYTEHLDGIDVDLSNVFAKLQEGHASYAESTSNYMSELDKHASKVTGSFGGAVREFGETVEDLADTTSELLLAIKEIRNNN